MNDNRGRDGLATIIALAISVVWATVALASIFTREYTPLSIVTPVMLIVAGFMFGLRVTKGNGDGDKKP